MADWITRWNDEIGAEPELPGVWRRKAGGFRIRARVTCPRTAKMVEINRALPDCKRAADALDVLARERSALREKLAAPPESPIEVAPNGMPLFATFAVELYKRKIKLGEASGQAKRGHIVSEKGKAKWNAALTKQLIPAFGTLPVDQIRYATVQNWIDSLPVTATKRRHRKSLPEGVAATYTARTVNTWLAILRAILRAAARKYEFVAPNLDDLDIEPAPVYTPEEPNSLRPDDVPRFLEKMREIYPQHYAMVFLGFVTGLRPSSMRPLRRRGLHADVKWEQGILHIRRSQTKGKPMESTKTGRRQQIAMPPELVKVLKDHADVLEDEMAKSDLLFPSVTGGYRSPSCLDDPFKAVAKAIELTYAVSPRAMRRTFQDLGRAAQVDDLVVRAISGHVTEAMQEHYSTVRGDEMQAGLAKVIDIATARIRVA